MCLTGRPVAGAVASVWGLVEDVVESSRVISAATELASRLATASPRAISTLRQLLRVSAEVPLAQGMALERAAFVECLQVGDGQEGIRAFLERRPPSWGVDVGGC
jgi:enoyl-CoA hydratase/carnithine racemase